MSVRGLSKLNKNYMNIIPQELTKKYLESRYDMGTGSDEWVGIKTDFENESDALGSTISYDNPIDALGLDKLKTFKSELEKFQVRINNYTPKDDLEGKEKVILQNKVDLGLQIYSSILDKKV